MKFSQAIIDTQGLVMENGTGPYACPLLFSVVCISRAPLLRFCEVGQNAVSGRRKKSR